MTERGGSPFATMYKRPTELGLFHKVTPSSAEVLAEFARQLLRANYCSEMARRHLRAALHVAVWAEEKGIALHTLTADEGKAFVKHATRCRCYCVIAGSSSGWPKRRRRRAVAALHVFRGFLHTGTVGSWEGDPPVLPPLVTEFQTWLAAHRGLTATTVRAYGHWAGAALSTLGDDPAKYTPLMIRRFMTTCWRKEAPSSIDTLARVLRHFIAFLSARGLCDIDLEGAVPRIRISRPAPPPFVLTSKDFKRTLRAAGDSLRDRAMLLLMFRLGLRPSDVAGLGVHDVRWSDGTILVSGKNKREELLPLPQDVGDALLAYLHDERPRSDSARVFLRKRAPHVPITNRSVIAMRIWTMKKAGVRLPESRAHIVRHSVTTDILRSKVPLSTLQQLLRHRRLSTTGTYCHVGQAVLRSVCQRWPA